MSTLPLFTRELVSERLGRREGGACSVALERLVLSAWRCRPFECAEEQRTEPSLPSGGVVQKPLAREFRPPEVQQTRDRPAELRLRLLLSGQYLSIAFACNDGKALLQVPELGGTAREAAEA